MFTVRHLYLFLSLFILPPVLAQDLNILPSQVATAASSAFHEYSGYTFDQLIGQNPNPDKLIVITKAFDPTPEGSVFHPGMRPKSHIEHLADSSDLLIQGTPVERWTIPNIENTFALSIYRVRVDSISYSDIKNQQTGTYVYIVRAGGPFTYKNRNFRAIETGFHLFHLNKPYIFFGKNVGGGVYKVDSDSSIEVFDGVPREASLAQKHAKAFVGKSPSGIMQEATSEKQLFSSHRGGNN